MQKAHAVVARSTFGRYTPLWHEAHLEVKSVKTRQCWKLRCGKRARRCGARHVWKQKLSKHRRFGRLLEVEMSKKCTPLRGEAHLEVKSIKTPGLRTKFGRFDADSMSKKCMPLWHEAHLEVNVSKTAGFEPLLMCQMSICSQIGGHRKS